MLARESGESLLNVFNRARRTNESRVGSHINGSSGGRVGPLPSLGVKGRVGSGRIIIGMVTKKI